MSAAPPPAGRAECPVLTCDRTMPAGQVMCAHCWAAVDKTTRRAIETANGHSKAAHIRSAIAQAQAVPR